MYRFLAVTLLLSACSDEQAPFPSENVADAGNSLTEDARSADLGDDVDAADLADAAVSDARPDVESSPLECLAAPATGSAVGEVPEDVVLLDCDGNEHRLRSLCAEEAAWVFVYTGWCPPCQENARIASEFAAEFEGDGFASYFVISQTQTFDEPDADYCAGIRDQFGLTMPVLFDPDQAMPAAVGTTYFDIDIVLGAGNELLFAEQHASREEVRGVISSRLP